MKNYTAKIAIFFASLIMLSACYSAQPMYPQGPIHGGPPVYTPPPPGFPVQTPIPQGKMCGGMMGSRCNNPNEFCQYPEQAQCGAADQSGVCRPRPQMCTQEYAPVCACNGRTYSNTCTAAGNGASVAYRGECR